MLRMKILYCSLAIMLVTGLSASAQNKTQGGKSNAVKPAAAGQGDEDVTKEERIPMLYKRLLAAIGRLKLEPDKDGAYRFKMKSECHYDMIDRLFYFINKNARVYVSQNRITKIVFEYYQYNMSSQVREVKIYTNTNPESGDLKSLSVEYTTNTGDKQTYTVGELQKPASKKEVVSQYYSYLLALTYKVEMLKDQGARLESRKIDHIIQLGE